MSRVAVPIIVLDPTGAPKSGASVAVKLRADNSDATVYQAESGATTVANPLTTDAVGRVTGWVERGAYNLNVTGSGISAFTEAWDAAPAGDAGIDVDWLAGAVLPLGMIAPYAGATDPAGGVWLLCDGRAVARTGDYADLYSVLGTTYGAGDGSTTFNLPDLRGRVPVGVDGAAGRLSSSDALGNSGGAERVTLSAAESGLPAHEHGLETSSTGGAGVVAGGAPVTTIGPGVLGAVGITGPTAASSSHQNMPPYVVTNYIIRAR